MSALAALAKTQSKVFLREPLAVFFGLVFPSVLLVVIGLAFPGATNPEPVFGGRALVDVYAATSIALGLATVGIFMLPVALGEIESVGSSDDCRRRRFTPELR